jgi:two-component system, chemotaxis family, protein-glutamate methylesterase/glutaminase
MLAPQLPSQLPSKQPADWQAGRKLRVLVVDDSAIVRKLLTDALQSQPDIEVVGSAPDAFVAREKIVSLKPDVLTLDIEMPRMDGVQFLKRLMQFHPLPVIIISSLGQPSSRAAVAALEAGAVEVLAKPDGPYSVGELTQTLAHKVRAAGAARLRRPTLVEVPATRTDVRPAIALLRKNARVNMIGLGASTGGTEALQAVLSKLPANMPPIVVVQHIPPVFSAAFAARLNELCALKVREAQDGDELVAGRVLIAPGGYHMQVEARGAGYVVRVSDKLPPVFHQRPAVDILFESMAEVDGAHSIAALLTGMGVDGAAGMAALKVAGAETIAQDEATSVVFGMPREAIRRGCVDRVLPLPMIAPRLLSACSM